ncbi:protein GAMETE EXPRESSED 2 isoform X1 [Jatropha curcas]|uniref:protein GAMETE EXPRESSED 2 isoform X1 n=1 Tax=Jatropha curcas TaxID=180498 RepID=UPI0009D6D439|nr:protein GAMETE EXPRESSED 2 isoform X1 [Jatropha curcas]
MHRQQLSVSSSESIMAFQNCLRTLTFFLGLLFHSSFAIEPPDSDKPQKPYFAFSWANDNNTFQAGDTAAIKIIVLGEFDSKGNASLGKSSFNPILTVNGKIGNSSFVSGVFLDTAGDTSTWKILFTPIRVGVFNVFIEDEPFEVFDSSLHFNAVAGQIYPSVCIASWMGVLNEYEAGAKATVFIVPRDAFGNNVSSAGEDLNPHNFSVSALYANGSLASVPNVTHIGWNEFGFIIIEFIAAKAGNLLLHVKGGNQTLIGSPLPFKVNPGSLDVLNCLPKWKFETNAWQIFSKMEIFIYQQDQYENLVSGLHEFDADITEKETNLSIPISDLYFEEVVPGIQLFSFSLLEPGNFLLTISDLKHNKSISNMPFAYNVFIGYCDGSASIVNGSGLNDSIAGEIAEFSLYLVDVFQYPAFVEVESIQVQIARENDSYYVQPSIHPIINGSEPARELSYRAIKQTEVAPDPSIFPRNVSTGRLKILASSFNVIYKPEKSGIYEIHVFCGNILLGGGHLFRKEVTAGEVNISLSKVVKSATKVPKLIENEIVVQLMDTFSNPVLSQQSRLNLEIDSVNRSVFSTGMFVDNNDGLYTCRYVAKDVGTYEMCVSFDGKRFTPCPFGANVYSSEYFPKAYDDTISVREDESIAVDVLANDYFAGNNASIVEFSKPDRGSLLQYGHLFRYTPYQGYYGNDSFMYTISDVNGNLASASVNISVSNIPPQFISFPSQLQATEDMLTPRLGGFAGFEISYSDPLENISVTLSADSGTLFLYPMPVQFWQTTWGEFSVKEDDDGARSLIIEGCVDVINLALQSIQYLGNDNFSGNDTIRLSASNINGKNELEVPAFVEPINDPPFINIPKFITLEGNGGESLIFNKARDKFAFCVGDPDLLNFPAKDKSHFLVKFSLEVDDGFLVTSLPAELINTTELKLMNSYQWLPLQTYVTISKHFTVKASGIRFWGTIYDCNLVLQNLLYNGGEHGVVLTVKLNDMGNYGCYSDCTERISMPLQAEATVNLIRSRPMSSLAVHTLGSVVFIEFLMVLSLGVALLFFTFKCAFHLVNERKGHKIENAQQSTVQNIQKESSSNNTSTYFTSCCSRLLSHQTQSSNFRQRSHHRFGIKESGEDICGPSESTHGNHPQTLPSFMPLAIEKGF